MGLSILEVLDNLMNLSIKELEQEKERILELQKEHPDNHPVVYRLALGACDEVMKWKNS
ncbi:hypothetical protein [uncultured Imperialibacter sp.]|uniref:hypothetical protein n=1 Tax=uncultured Imperialibacter sp. TaxID=1672639 RepID=UPI0030D9054E|tara:strand:- start:20217 stop:20393 length:177 start_codon:yes stop_codon:yes gene_type:complete